MHIEMSILLLALATVLAPMARGQSTPPQPKITGVLTILSPKPGVTPEQVLHDGQAHPKARGSAAHPSWMTSEDRLSLTRWPAKNRG